MLNQRGNIQLVQAVNVKVTHYNALRYLLRLSTRPQRINSQLMLWWQHDHTYNS